MRNVLAVVFLVLIYSGLHTQLAVVSGGHMVIPFALCAAGAIGVMTLFPGRFSLAVLRWFVLLVGLLVVMAIITSMRAGNLTQRLVSAGDLVYSLMLGYCVFVAISALGIRWCSRIFLAAALLLILGSVLEVYGGLRPVSDAFRNATQEWHSEYSGVYGGVNGDIRDQMLYGSIRPKFFALEPSILGISAGTAILYWFMSSGKFSSRRILGAAFLATAAFLIIRSPTIVLCFLMACEFYVADLYKGSRSSRANRTLMSIVILVAIALLPFVSTVFAQYTHGGSFLSREVIPAVMAAAVLRTYPLFGTGLGGYEQWGQFAFSAINSKWGIVGYRQLLSTLIAGGPYAARFLVSNGLWEFWIECGILGGAAVLFCLMRILRGLRVPDPLFVICISAVGFTAIGGVSSPVEWIPLLSLAALYKKHRSPHDDCIDDWESSGLAKDDRARVYEGQILTS